MIAALVRLLGCAVAAPECVDAGDCAEGQTCRGGTCQQVECLASEDCDLRQYCEPQLFVCFDGCKNDDDCLAGETCNTDNRTCVTYGCRDTQLDCYYNEECNERTGNCQLSDEAHCKPCLSSGTCDGGDCLGFGTPQDYCLMPCSPGDECPRGYTCADATGNNDFYCFGWCPLYDEFGYLPW